MTVLDEIKRLNDAAAASGRPPQKPVSTSGKPIPAAGSPSAGATHTSATSDQSSQYLEDTEIPAHGPASAKPAHLQDIQHTSSNQPLLSSHAVDDDSHSQDGAVSLDGQQAAGYMRGDQATPPSAWQVPEGRSTKDAHAPLAPAQGPAGYVHPVNSSRQHFPQRVTGENIPAAQHVQRATAENVPTPQHVQRVTAEHTYPTSPTDTIAAVKSADPAGGTATDLHAVTGYQQYQQPWSPPASHQAQLAHAATEDVPALTARDARGKPQDAMGNAIKRILPDQEDEPLTLYYRRNGFNDFSVGSLLSCLGPAAHWLSLSTVGNKHHMRISAPFLSYQKGV